MFFNWKKLKIGMKGDQSTIRKSEKFHSKWTESFYEQLAKEWKENLGSTLKRKEWRRKVQWRTFFHRQLLFFEWQLDRSTHSNNVTPLSKSFWTMNEQKRRSKSDQTIAEWSPRVRRQLVFEDNRQQENERLVLDHNTFMKQLEEMHQKIITEKCERWGIDFLCDNDDYNSEQSQWIRFNKKTHQL